MQAILEKYMRNLLRNDMSTTLEYFKYLRAENSSFYSTIELDDYSRVSHVFWVDGSSRLAYENFGHVVSLIPHT